MRVPGMVNFFSSGVLQSIYKVEVLGSYDPRRLYKNPHFFRIMRSDGQLKDAADMQWFNDADADVPMCAPPKLASASFSSNTTSSFRSSSQLKYLVAPRM